MPSITEKELLQFLKAIEEGAIFLRPESDPQDIYAGNVTYTACNGWRITIFNDCNTWDYVDKVITADGRSVDFDSIDNDMPTAREYLPADEIAWEKYGIPGYCHFRCVHCGADLADYDLRKAPFLCDPCKALRKHSS
ncbi:MAG TPA: hypothetical protein VGJ30_18380 [Candidatus Angelobacter sp.]|jgi:hypothetical protein